MTSTKQQSDDWADELARTIIQDDMLLPPYEFRMLLAERLRVVKAEGRLQGITETGDAVLSQITRVLQ